MEITRHIPNRHLKALTIAGSDPSGGAGIQADLRVFTIFRIYATAIITALTIQDTRGVQEVIPLRSDILERELRILLEDSHFDAIKTGMIYSVESLTVIREIFSKYKVERYVLDPIILSSNGIYLLSKDAIDLLKGLFPMAILITPNIQEAEILSGIRIRSEEDMMESARVLHSCGARYVLITGGHLRGDPVDILYDGSEYKRFVNKRIPDKDIHGTGCVFSSAITAGLARGLKVEDAIGEAKRFINIAIKDSFKVGKGREVI